MSQIAAYESGAQPIAGFRLVDFLGRGPFGEVWSADDEGAGRVVALKIMDLTFGGGSVADFRALTRMTALAHPNLVPVFTTRLKDKAGKELDPEQAEIARQRGELKELVLVMGLGEKSLAERLREANPEGTPSEDRKGLPVEELFRYLYGAAKGIDYLNRPDHHLGEGDGPILHGGVKPRNLFVFGTGELRVADAGLYALLAANIRKALAATNPAYTAPEVAANQPGPASDQYALAVCYYELRTGRLPFDEGMGHNSIVMAHSLGRLDFSSPNLTDAEREVLKRATAMDPEDRYLSCVKLVRDLSRAAEPLFPDKSVRTLTDTAGVPYLSPLRPDSYWRAVLTEEEAASLPPDEAMADAEPDDEPTLVAEAASPETSVAVAMQTPPPAEYRLSVPNVRATPILLPLDPRSPTTDRARPAAPAGRTVEPPLPDPSPVAEAPPPPASPKVPPPPTPAATTPPPVPRPEARRPAAQARVRRAATPAAAPAPAAVPSVAGRQVTVRYYSRMTPGRTFALDIELSAWQLREAARKVAGPAATLDVEPLLPGCDCYPRRGQLPIGAAGEPTTVAFRVVPRAVGRADGARVLVRQGGRVVAEVPLDVAVRARSWAWACVAAGLLAPFAVVALRAIPDPAAGVFETAGQWIGGHVPPDLVGFGLLGLAAGLFVRLAPRPAVVTREVG